MIRAVLASRAWRPIALLILGSALGSILLLAAGGQGALIGIVAAIEGNRALLIGGFAAWALIANCIVLPAGSLSLMAGGAMMGAALPAAIWFAAQLITAPLHYRVSGKGAAFDVETLVRRYLGAGAVNTLRRAAEAGIETTIVLRLTPVLPSAPAALIACWAGIDLRAFLIGSSLAGWVRPLYFASLGAAVGSLTRVGEASDALSFASLAPLGLAFLCAAIALWLRLRLSPAPAIAPPTRAPHS